MKSILIYRIGALGDTLVSLPALWAVREHFAGSKLTMLCDYQVRQRYVLAADLLRGSGIVDDFMLYPVDHSRWGRVVRDVRMVKLLAQLRRRQFDAVVYLAPSQRTTDQIDRDARFFRLAGIPEILAMQGFSDLPEKVPGQPLPAIPLEADHLLARLAASGISIPAPGKGRKDLSLIAADDEVVEKWLAKQRHSSAGRPWIAIGPGSKMPAKVWPADRYRDVVQKLIARFDVWPVIFGGSEDRSVGETLLQAWGRGYIAAGDLGLRASAAALKRCSMYLGNDTGTMHLAASADVTCVALFSARSHPHQWNPYGDGHRVFRTQIECEGCLLVDCVERAKACLMQINSESVYEACVEVLENRAAGVTSEASRRRVELL